MANKLMSGESENSSSKALPRKHTRDAVTRKDVKGVEGRNVTCRNWLQRTQENGCLFCWCPDYCQNS